MTMWKMILGQTVYKLALSFMLYFAGDSLLDAHLSSEPELRAKQLSTVVFNTFVWMQIFNELNNRRLDNGFNVFEGILKNYWFMGINVVMVAGQIMIVLVGGAAFGVTRINGVLWAVCLVCAAGCLPWALVLRTIPDRHFGFVFNAVVDGTTFVLRPFIKGFKLISRGLRAFLQLVKRFTRRLLPRAQSKTDIFPDAVKSSDSPVIDEESPASNKLKKLDHSDSPSQEPKTPPSIVLPPVTVTTSLDSGLSPMPLGG
jgi:Ca2+-transporting ATPase